MFRHRDAVRQHEAEQYLSAAAKQSRRMAVRPIDSAAFFAGREILHVRAWTGSTRETCGRASANKQGR
ncbi:hypothetical protein CDO22_14040 [Sinorhizobium meliloti]|nr:hypothetical protein DU99_11970 [Sinorhizobium meliloti]ASP98642.1 hypothetical protein CDO24_15100 [Sinorhizobium meliloti]ASQ11173.1 hypothetical protein CDO22_14040 [Sinorhizobium meliloti]ATA99450.1 hypothetical protein BWO76_24910 [Sinorhizobium meliloti]ATB05458.1 hypothetical protein BWO90_26730 [Sinorhizobium meliloti]